MTNTNQGINARVSSRLACALAALLGCTSLTGCLVAGYSSGGGFFLWPGSLGLLVVILIIIFIARRR